jgi:hypothetical protein
MFYGYRKPKHFDVFFNDTKPKFLAKSYFVKKQSYHMIIGLPWAINSKKNLFASGLIIGYPFYFHTDTFFFIIQ